MVLTIVVLKQGDVFLFIIYLAIDVFNYISSYSFITLITFKPFIKYFI